MKKRPMVLIFTGTLSGTAVVWNRISMTTAFYFLVGVCLTAILIDHDRRYGLMIAGAILGIVFSVFAKISMNLDLSQVRAHADRYRIGRVLETSKTKTGKQALLLKNDALEGEILLYSAGDRKIVPGDIVSFEENPEIWDEAANPGQFSSRHYYFSKRIYYHVYSKNIKIERHTRTGFRNILLGCREYFKKQLKRQYNEEVGSFLNGMILGDKTELSDEVKDDFKESGLIHLLAVSGLHISLVGRKLYELIRRFCRSFVISAVFGISGAFIYCMLTGMSVSSLRAVIMLFIYFLAQILGEHYDLLSSASFAGVVILIMHPYRIYDTGFLYSFTAVFLIGCYQMIKPKMKGKFQKIRETLLFCIWIQIGMFPVIIYFQYEAPVFSFIANVAAVPLATAGFSIAFIFIFFPSTVFHKAASSMIEIVLFISRQSYGMFTIGYVPFFWVMLWYGILVLWVRRNGCKLDKIKFLVRTSGVYIGMIMIVLIPFFRKQTIAFLDVGQGDCFVADTCAGLIVSDGGSSSVDQVGRYRILPYMKYRGYQKIKIAVISHMDIDHYSGIKELLEMGRVEYLGLPDIPKDDAMQQIIKIAKQKKTKVFYLSKGRKIQTEDSFLEILHPTQNSLLEKNAASLVMQGQVLGYKILLTADVEKEGEEQLLSEGIKNIEILKAAHHGSKNSTSDKFLQKVLPEQTVISCGQNNRYGHPHRETINRLKTYHTKILRTDKSGAVIFQKKR